VALQALVVEKSSISKGSDVMLLAVQYLATNYSAGHDGGWAYQPGGSFGSDSDVNSTSYVVEALSAVTGLEGLVQGGQQFILSLQNPSGAFGYQKSQADDNAGATYQAVPALLGATLINPVPASPPSLPVVTPGMPTTGDGFESSLAALAIFSALASVAAGAIVRRRATAR
jgi:hypothetical protein